MLSRTMNTLFVLCLLAIVSCKASATISQDPLFLVQYADPRVMFAMSNDHQLFVKAYTDYTDLNEDGVLDTTYADSVEYYGYFNPNACYSHDGSKFNPVANVTTGHACAGSHWSGNFLNWATMTRMDVIRKMIYGGSRSVDSTSTTVLERSFLPDDVHAFVKVYRPANASDMALYTPYSSETSISICNLSDETSGVSRDSTADPIMRVASGSYVDWSAMETVQCAYGSSSSQPSSSDALATLEVRVTACNSSYLSDNCQRYENNGSPIYKPTGVLQDYGGGTAPIRFGLLTGSYTNNISGGVLRRNLENISDEWDAVTGQLLKQGDSDYSISKTLERLRTSNWNFSSNKYADCDSPGISIYNFKNSSANNVQCTEWGNPVAEIYLEALRYLSQGRSSTALTANGSFNVSGTDQISGLISETWRDPYLRDPTNSSSSKEWCADFSLITLSTALNSFDTDDLSSASDLGIDSSALTNRVGDLQGITNNNYLVGDAGNGDASDGQCAAKKVDELADVKGTCPEQPRLEGGFHIAGLAFHSRTEDLRPDITPGNTGSPDNVQTITNYTVALAETLPKIEIPVPVGSDRKVSLLPHCEANSNGSANTSSSGWRQCSLADLSVTEMDLYNGEPVKGTFRVNWEDSTWGNDYDMDAIVNLSFCVGAYCADPAVDSNEIKITIDPQGASAGHALLFGYSLLGTSNKDGVVRRLVLAGGCLGTDFPAASYQCKDWNGNWRGTYTSSESDIYISAASSTTAQLLEDPLWYAGKFGGFNDLDGDKTPANTDATSPNKEWDADGDGRPDRYYQVTNPAKLVDALSNVFNDIVARTSSASAVATNSTRLDTNSRIYQARFSSADWSGSLLAYDLNDNSGAVDVVLWNAADLIPSTRSIFSYGDQDADGDEDGGVSFDYSNLTTIQKTYLNSSQLAFIKGDQSNEGNLYRERSSTVLGDIINSDPLFSTGSDDFGYYGLEIQSGVATYNAYLKGTVANTQKGVRQDMLYVGANDGMLHAFLGSGSTVSGCNPDSSACEGEEVFAYIPKAVIPNLANLTSTTYQHQYFVDNPPIQGDAYIDFDNDGDERWGTALVGTLGAGGKGIFALDISNPSNFTASDVLWDLDEQDLTQLDGSNYDLGYTFSTPSIVKLHNGKWGVIFGNGYESASGKAILYIRDLLDGSEIATIDTEQGNTSAKNGLSTPIAIDTNGDKVADYVYAGDLQGNMWKFDITASNASNWDVSYSSGSGNNKVKKPLFQACATSACSATQPITTKPQVINGKEGLVVLFGTGQYYETNDNSTTDLQSYYGIFDKGIMVASKNDLLQQTILGDWPAGHFTGVNYAVRVTSDNAVDYNAHKGWYMDFDSSNYPGERVVSKSLVRNGRVIFPTLVPATDSCSYGGTSWLMELDAQSGSRLLTSPFDVNDDGSVNDGDKISVDLDGDGTEETVVVSGKKSEVGIISQPGVISKSKDELKYTSGSSGSIEVTLESSGSTSGRQSWQQIR